AKPSIFGLYSPLPLRERIGRGVCRASGGYRRRPPLPPRLRRSSLSRKGRGPVTTIGFVGLGRMGAPMAARLLGHVDKLLVHDISTDAVTKLVAQGAEAAGSAAALGERCEIVFMSLPTPPIVRAAVNEAISGGAPRIACDLSTSGPALAQELHALL